MLLNPSVCNILYLPSGEKKCTHQQLGHHDLQKEMHQIHMFRGWMD